MRQVLGTMQPVSATEIVTQEELACESPELVQKAIMEITPTPRARPSHTRGISSGMVLFAAAPVSTPAGRRLGVLYGGVLLNRNYEIVDGIRAPIFREQMYQGREVGTATIFPGDVRISTNVRNEDGRRAITTQVSDEVADEVLALVKNQASFRNISIKTDLDPALPFIMADGDQMRQVALNIVLNAADAMPQGGELLIKSKFEPVPDAVVIRISDTGTGISDEIRDRLFEPFFTTKKTGTGLGLAIAYGIVERHKGILEVESEVGQGTTFTISLPVNGVSENGNSR